MYLRATGDRRRRFADGIPGRVLPLERAGLEIEREQIAVARADVDDPVRDRGRRLDRLARLIGPLERRRRGDG
jgi:hypothetical protein